MYRMVALYIHANPPVLGGTSCFFHSLIELIFRSFPFLYEISLLCPAIFDSIYNFLLLPAMFLEIQRRVPLLSWLKLACTCNVYIYVENKIYLDNPLIK